MVNKFDQNDICFSQTICVFVFMFMSGFHMNMKSPSYTYFPSNTFLTWIQDCVVPEVKPPGADCACPTPPCFTLFQQSISWQKAKPFCKALCVTFVCLENWRINEILIDSFDWNPVRVLGKYFVGRCIIWVQDERKILKLYGTLMQQCFHRWRHRHQVSNDLLDQRKA